LNRYEVDTGKSSIRALEMACAIMRFIVEWEHAQYGSGDWLRRIFHQAASTNIPVSCGSSEVRTDDPYGTMHERFQELSGIYGNLHPGNHSA